MSMNIRAILRSSIIMGVGLAVMAPSAIAQTIDPQIVDPVTHAAQLNAQGKANQAYSLLADLVSKRAGEPRFDYMLGLAAADSGRPAEAIIAFQRVLSVEPDNAQARAELARAYALAGDVDTARDQFNTVVQDPSLPDPVRQRFDSIVRNYDRQISGGGTGVSGFVDVSGGLDTNVNAATDLTQITIPLFAGFGPGALGAGARKTDDEFYDITTGVSVVKAISRQSRLFGSALGNWRDNLDTTAFDQAALTGTAGVAHTLANKDVISASAQLQQFWLAHDPYRQSYGGVVQYTHRLSGGRALSLSGEYFSLNFENDPLRDSDRYSVALSYADRNLIASVSAGTEETTRNAANHLSFDFAKANIGFEKPIASLTSLVGGISGEIQGYDAADPLFLKSRSDERIDASIGLKHRVTDTTFLRPRLSYTRNWSNIALYDYDRFTVSLGVRKEF